jgi:hypothetical protein
LAGPGRTPLLQENPVFLNRTFIYLSCKEGDNANDTPLLPSEPPRSSPGFPLIPTEGSLDLAEVDQLGFDFDHHRYPGLPMGGEDVNKAARSGAPDLHLVGHPPSGCLQPTPHVRRTAGMRGIALKVGAGNVRRAKLDKDP